jgi:N-acyl-D-aspartate/D-glutamate deacylase
MDSSVRDVMKAAKGDWKHPLNPNFDRWSFTLSPSRPDYGGRTVADLASEQGIHPVDVLCDQIVADDLATLIDVPIFNLDQEGVVRFLEDDGTLLGLGDAGAHVMSVTNYRYPTFLLEDLVNRQGALSIETAIRRMTSLPADIHGLAGRGRLEVGANADLCVIDRESIGLDPVEVHHDLPGGAPRLVQKGHGFRHVFVNGIATIEDDQPTGERPGMMLSATDSRPE